MKRILGGLVLLLCIFGFVLYQFLGGRYWLQMSDVIMKTKDTAKREQLTTEVWGKEGIEYGGVVMKATKTGVWLWGNKGPRYFAKRDGASVYYFYDTCNAEGLKSERFPKVKALSRA